MDRKKDLQYQADTADARVNEYFRKNPMTGDPFKDIGGLLATRDDRNRAIAARKSLEADADRDVTMRGQDITKELGLGEIAVRRDANQVARMGHTLGFAADTGRTAAYEKGQNQQFELGKGELDLNRDIFGMTKDRYENVGKVSDLFALAERAANTRVGAAQAGIELSDDLFKATEKYFKPESSTFKPAKIYDENDIAFNYVPDEAQPEFDSSAAFPEYLRKKDWQSYSNPAIGALNEGAKSVMRGVDLGLQYLRPVEDVMMGMKPGASARAVARPAVRNKLRRRVIK